MQETTTTAATAIHERPVSRTAPSEPSGTAVGLDDPRFLQVLTTEHWSLLTSRSLAYNEAFTRTSMFLTFLSMSFVALALVGTALSFSRDFLVIAAIAVTFDVLIGLLTYIRIGACNVDDLRAVHGMNRIRHGYVQVVPPAAGYFVSGTFDDAASVAESYGSTTEVSAARNLVYGLSTSFGMVGLIVSLVSGILGALIALLLDVAWPLPLLAGVVVAAAAFACLAVYALRAASRAQTSLPVAFPRDSVETPSRRGGEVTAPD
jgi:hypothetical protein